MDETGAHDNLADEFCATAIKFRGEEGSGLATISMVDDSGGDVGVTGAGPGAGAAVDDPVTVAVPFVKPERVVVVVVVADAAEERPVTVSARVEPVGVPALTDPLLTVGVHVYFAS